jgi:hypothetical protein
MGARGSLVNKSVQDSNLEVLTSDEERTVRINTRFAKLGRANKSDHRITKSVFIQTRTDLSSGVEDSMMAR